MIDTKVLFEVLMENGELVTKAKESTDAIDGMGDSTEKTNKSFSKLKIGAAAIGAAIVAAGVAFKRMVSEQLSVIDAEANMARRFNVTMEVMGKFKHIAGITGIDVNVLGETLQELELRLAKIPENGDTATGALNKLGLSLTDLKALSPEDQFYTIAESIQDMDDSFQQAVVAEELFGDKSKQILGTIRDGGDAFRAMGDEAERLGFVLSEKAATSVEELNDNMFRLEQRKEGIKRQMTAELAPALNGLAEAFLRSTSDGGAMKKMLDGVVWAMSRLITGITNIITWMDTYGDNKAYANQQKAVSALAGQQKVHMQQLQFYAKQYGITMDDVFSGKVIVEGNKQFSNEFKHRFKLFKENQAQMDASIQKRDKLLGVLQMKVPEAINSQTTPPGSTGSKPPIVSDIDDVAMAAAAAANTAGGHFERMYNEWSTALEDMHGEYNTFISGISALSGQLGQIFSMSAANSTANLENESKRRMNIIKEQYDMEREAIEGSLLTAENKGLQLNMLDEARARDEKSIAEETEKEKLKVARKAAERQKKINMFETAVNIPNAAFAAWKSAQVLPYPGSMIVGGAMAAFATGLGLKQLQMIKDQPLPAYAKGSWGIKEDHAAIVHKGEKIIPRSFSQALDAGEITLGSKGGGDTYITIEGSVIDKDGFFQAVYDANRKIERQTGLNVYSRNSVY